MIFINKLELDWRQVGAFLWRISVILMKSSLICLYFISFYYHKKFLRDTIICTHGNSMTHFVCGIVNVVMTETALTGEICVIWNWIYINVITFVIIQWEITMWLFYVEIRRGDLSFQAFSPHTVSWWDFRYLDMTSR